MLGISLILPDVEYNLSDRKSSLFLQLFYSMLSPSDSTFRHISTVLIGPANWLRVKHKLSANKHFIIVIEAAWNNTFDRLPWGWPVPHMGSFIDVEIAIGESFNFHLLTPSSSEADMRCWGYIKLRYLCLAMWLLVVCLLSFAYP